MDSEQLFLYNDSEVYGMPNISNNIQLFSGDCFQYLRSGEIYNVALTFVDPPFRQGKDYRFFDDTIPDDKYWNWMEGVLRASLDATIDGGSVYFMQREKNAEDVLRVFRESGWIYQNLIIYILQGLTLLIEVCQTVPDNSLCY